MRRKPLRKRKRRRKAAKRRHSPRGRKREKRGVEKRDIRRGGGEPKGEVIIASSRNQLRGEGLKKCSNTPGVGEGEKLIISLGKKRRSPSRWGGTLPSSHDCERYIRKKRSEA